MLVQRVRSGKLSLIISAGAMAIAAAGIAAQQSTSSSPYTFRQTVRRVIVDVVVTDRNHNPVHGLTRRDFKVYEDGHEQEMRSWESFDMDRDKAFVPPHMPPLPPDTFMDVPQTPERGPLYVIVYDAVDMSPPDRVTTDQMFARKQLQRFLDSKPEGTRFELYYLGDGFRLMQGFTTDKQKLLDAFDVKRRGGHIPWAFLYAQNYGQGDGGLPFEAMVYIAKNLEGLPGRKNLIWLSSEFPIAFAGPTAANNSVAAGSMGMPAAPNGFGAAAGADEDSILEEELLREAADSLNLAQVSVYPIDVQGLNPEAAGGGIDLIADQIANATGGHAYYNGNDLVQMMQDATENGGSYYEMSYEPPGVRYDGKLHGIKVTLDKPGYSLAYRQYYFDDDPNKPMTNDEKRMAEATANHAVAHRPGDSLYARMVQGAPMAHDILFRAQIHAATPVMATREQMADLQWQPAYFVLRKRNHQAKPLPPIPLQRYTIDYLVLDQQAKFRAGQVLEFAACAYDPDGRMLNGISQKAVRTKIAGGGKKGDPPLFRAEQTLDVPTTAQWLRVAVRNVATDRIGTIEVKLPLAADQKPLAATAAEVNPPTQ